MEISDIMRHCDHTMIKSDCTYSDIITACNDAVEYGCATVVVPNVYVPRVKEYLGDRCRIDTLAGFPYGYNSTASKVFEAKEAIEDGADEVDMVVDVSMVKSGEYAFVKHELEAMRDACGYKILKVIIETCLLTDDEKIRLCELVSAADIDYIKTSTGFVGPGANEHDIELMVKHVSGRTKVKAAGGIKSFDEAARYIELGADRIGTSRLVSILKSETPVGNY